jgi:GAF domain-containing protein
MDNSAVPGFDEQLRLEALRPYQLFNTMKDETFTELVRLAAKIFNVPMGIIAFVEADTVRFGLNHGLPSGMDKVNRWETLCSVALLHESVSVYEDLHSQPCDLIDPILVRKLNLRFYAGVTLRTTTGFPIGVLCVIDHKARMFYPEESVLLERMGAVVMELLDLRLHLIQQPTWNQQLWEAVYKRVEASVSRLDTLASLAGWEEQEDSEAALAYRASTQDEILRVISILLELIRKARG